MFDEGQSVHCASCTPHQCEKIQSITQSIWFLFKVEEVEYIGVGVGVSVGISVGVSPQSAF